MYNKNGHYILNKSAYCCLQFIDNLMFMSFANHNTKMKMKMKIIIILMSPNPEINPEDHHQRHFEFS